MNSIYSQTAAWASSRQLPLWQEPVTPSTNDTAKSEAASILEPIKLYLADQQTQGRGRGSNTWLNTEPGNALLSTWSLGMSESPQHLTSMMIGLALFRAVQQTWKGSAWSLKPPNDLYCGDNKVAGLLLETVREGARTRLLVGLGINVGQPPAGVPRAGGISQQVPASALQNETWQIFLDRWLHELKAALPLIHRNELSLPQCAELVSAVKFHPDLKDQFLDLSIGGTLSFKNGQRVGWQDL